MKNKIIVLFLILLSFILISCSEERLEGFISYNFYNLSTEYNIEDSEISLYFLENSYLPLVSVKDYLLMLDGIYVSEEFEFVEEFEQERIQINLNVTYDEEDYNSYLIIDAINDTIYVDSLIFFDLYMEGTETDYSEGLISLEPIITEGTDVTYNLGNYNFDILYLEDDIYLPFVIANLIFNQSNYFDTYYNGDKIIGVDTSRLEPSNLKNILMSSNNNKLMPKDLKEANYNFYTFIIDYFYGLKEDRNIVNAKTFINKQSFLKGDVEKNIFDITNKLDDLHTSHMTRGFYENGRLQNSYLSFTFGNNVNNFYNGLSSVRNEINNSFTNNPFKEYVTSEYLDSETLILYISGFIVDTPVEVENIIKNATNETKNIIIDISYNTGGNLGAVIRMFTLMTNEEIKYHFKNPLNNERATYRNIGEKEAYDNYNYFIKISSVTFSAANLTASIAKELEIPVIGKKSSGGASAISFFVFPTGSIIIMSSNLVLTDKDYHSIELGIEPNIVLNKLYNTNEILTAISKND